MPVFRYRFAAGTLDRLAANQVAWQVVLFVLEFGHPALREHIGSSLCRVVAADPRGELLMVILLELTDEDDTYEILSARYLGPDESAAAGTLLRPKEDR